MIKDSSTKLEIVIDTIPIDNYFIHIIIDIYKSVGVTVSTQEIIKPMSFTDIFKASNGVN